MSTIHTAAAHDPAPPEAQPPFDRRVRIWNYKSIAYCDVPLGPLTVIVGRNGSGKSNFLDALAFVSEALRTSVREAVRSRNGFDHILKIGASQPGKCGFELELEMSGRAPAFYRLELGDNRVEHESIRSEVGSLASATGELAWGGRGLRLFFGGTQERRMSAENVETFNKLKYLISYNARASLMRTPQKPDVGDLLYPDGGNLAGVLRRIEAERPELKERIIDYLRLIVPGIVDVRHVPLGPVETLYFEQGGADDGSILFYVSQMSDGTLRAPGSLVAVNPLANGEIPVSLVGIEEPEAALHPAASGVLMDAFREAAAHTQVVVTTHSPDLLDEIDPESDVLLVAQMRGGGTEIGPMDVASREAVREHWYSPGELLRMDQLGLDAVGLRP